MHDSTMEGTLWKWTNYFSGWQSRWFVLNDGILSYYKSEDDVNNGCKGSIKMCVCDVNVHNTDNTRLDLTIPGEAHFYVKAATPQERQQWLVALGSCKACLRNGKPSTSSISSIEELPGEELKGKKSELRLYCDLLMQQVHSVKSAVQTTEEPDVEVTTSLLSATCDTFIQTLEDCMDLSQSSLNKAESANNPPTPTRKSSSASAKLHHSELGSQLLLTISSHNSNSCVITLCDLRGNSQRTKLTRLQISPPTEFSLFRYIPLSSAKRPRSRTASESSQNSVVTAPRSPNDATGIPENPLAAELPLPVPTFDKLPTFISTMPCNFSDIELGEDNSVPTVQFLDACRAILPIFDKLSQTAFTPIKLDVVGNIRKIHQKYSTNPESFNTLQTIVLYEIQQKQSHLSNSATVAILWLKRTLDFIREFIREYLLDSEDTTSIVQTAYVKTLKEFHGWVVRGVFAVAVKSLPTHEELLEVLTSDPSDALRPNFLLSVQQDMQSYVEPLQTITTTLHEFYTLHDLDSKQQV
ncbi:hypothetical protein CAPTEDRAFT_159602 [Capitella teleta]|uniref:Pleckstrin homology domain-containing family A member 8 n=1 Tax=Capitella teleta TaxID=283909 RepID=R7TEE6_CAPTE|nr:hypothetical protein CAPTEDRAFT_159602 [Capitella teleta]|eukprot:ELT92104.1 hypothetical protein CAPTEDRAFT_159602 [Capitella teleta]